MTPLVLVHGFLGGSDQWTLQAPLKDARRLVALDLPGFGRNAALPPLDRIEGFAAWVLDTLADQGVERFDLLGHSMGGMVVQEMIRQQPAAIRKLILYGTGATGILPGRFETIETSIARAEAEGAPATARRIAATWFLHGEAATEYPACAAIAERAAPEAIQAGLMAMKTWVGEDHLQGIRAPTLVICGDADRSYSWAQTQSLWQTVEDSSLAVLPGCAHAAHLEAPDLFNGALERFLQT